MPSLPAADPCDPRPQLTVIERIEALHAYAKRIADKEPWETDSARSVTYMVAARNEAQLALASASQKHAEACICYLFGARNLSGDATLRDGITNLLGDCLLAAMHSAGSQPSQN